MLQRIAAPSGTSVLPKSPKSPYSLRTTTPAAAGAVGPRDLVSGSAHKLPQLSAKNPPPWLRRALATPLTPDEISRLEVSMGGAARAMLASSSEPLLRREDLPEGTRRPRPRHALLPGGAKGEGAAGAINVSPVRLKRRVRTVSPRPMTSDEVMRRYGYAPTEQPLGP